MSVLDACAGGGIYAFPLADLGCKVTAGDLIDVNVAHIHTENSKNPKLKHIYQGSVLDLSCFTDESFDVVLNLGSYYHLCDESDRQKSLTETLRVLKNGGIYVISYINRCADYMAHFREFQDNYPFLVNYMHNGFIENSTLFYSTTPEMMEADLQNQNIKVLHHIATDGPIFIYRDIVENMDKSDFEAFMDIHLTHCDKKSNLGYSEHGLIVAQKRGRSGMNDQELLSKIETVLQLLGRKREQYPDSEMVQMLTQKYAKAKADVENGQAAPVYLLGGSRAYLDAFSDWENNPLLDAIGAVEKAIKSMR